MVLIFYNIYKYLTVITSLENCVKYHRSRDEYLLVWKKKQKKNQKQIINNKMLNKTSMYDVERCPNIFLKPCGV